MCSCLKDNVIVCELNLIGRSIYDLWMYHTSTKKLPFNGAICCHHLPSAIFMTMLGIHGSFPLKLQNSPICYSYHFKFTSSFRNQYSLNSKSCAVHEKINDLMKKSQLSSNRSCKFSQNLCRKIPKPIKPTIPRVRHPSNQFLMIGQRFCRQRLKEFTFPQDLRLWCTANEVRVQCWPSAVKSLRGCNELTIKSQRGCPRVDFLLKGQSSGGLQAEFYPLVDNR